MNNIEKIKQEIMKADLEGLFCVGFNTEKNKIYRWCAGDAVTLLGALEITKLKYLKEVEKELDKFDNLKKEKENEEDLELRGG